MPEWKKNIFLRVVKKRMLIEKRTALEIIKEYTKLTKKEQKILLDEIIYY